MNNPDLSNGDLGYQFIPFKHRDSIGFKDLVINITEKQTGEHFDPVHVSLPATFNGNKTYEHLTVFHPFTAASDLQLAPGIITMKDRKGKKEEAFSFGGTAYIDVQPGCTTCCLISTAPILFSNHSNRSIQCLMEEIQILLAERRASWIRDEEAFERKMMACDPLILYTAILSSIKAHFSDRELQSLGPNRKMLNLIRKEINDLKHAREWPAYIPSITELL